MEQWVGMPSCLMNGLQPQHLQSLTQQHRSHSPSPMADAPEKPDAALLPPKVPLFAAKDLFAPVAEANDREPTKDFPVKKDLTLEMDLGSGKEVQGSVKGGH